MTLFASIHLSTVHPTKTEKKNNNTHTHTHAKSICSHHAILWLAVINGTCLAMAGAMASRADVMKPVSKRYWTNASRDNNKKIAGHHWRCRHEDFPHAPPKWSCCPSFYVITIQMESLLSVRGEDDVSVFGRWKLRQSLEWRFVWNMWTAWQPGNTLKGKAVLTDGVRRSNNCLQGIVGVTFTQQVAQLGIPTSWGNISHTQWET